MDKSLLKKTISYLFYIFAFGVFVGCICLNILWRIQDEFYRWNWLIALRDLKVYVEKIPYYLDIKVGIWLLIPFGSIFLLGFWKYGKVLLQGTILLLGFLIGGLETIWIFSIDLKAGLLLGVSLLKRIAIPIITGILFLVLANMMSLLHSKKGVRKYLFYSLFILFFYLVYLFLPSYVNFF